ncbi:MAG: DUF4923 family protein [Bacteroidaceae bacterium]|nr:DUF4923 family protein [Bacteroidaceae bacterium]MBR1903126.1 DUF4923 family protein [Bacteroidaceae bacterium]
MKRNLSILSLVLFSIVLSSCQAFNYQKDTKTDASSLLDNALAGNTSQTTTDLLGRVLSYLLYGNTISQDNIIGTWTYSSPKVIFESENILAKLGSDIASDKIEQTLGDQLSRIGFAKGKTTLTFNKDNTCSFTYGSRTYPGTYKFDASANRLTITDAFGVGNVKCTACKNGNELYLLFDSNKVLSVLNTLSNSSLGNATAASVLGNYKGLKLGWSMTK